MIRSKTQRLKKLIARARRNQKSIYETVNSNRTVVKIFDLGNEDERRGPRSIAEERSEDPSIVRLNSVVRKH
jgi:hypothetical protein